MLERKLLLLIIVVCCCFLLGLGERWVSVKLNFSGWFGRVVLVLLLVLM